MRERRAIDHLRTRSSLLRRATAVSGDDRRGALGELVERYRAPLVEYVRGSWRLQDDDAQDVVQQFLLDKVIAGRVLRAYDPQRGRFRALLLRALDNFVVSSLRRRRKEVPARPRDGEPRAPGADPAHAFHRAWARSVIEEALALMEQRHAATDPRGMRLFQARIVAPAFDGATPPSYAALVEELGFASPTEAMNLLTTAKRRYATCLRAVVARYAGRAADLEQEIGSLLRALEEPR